MSRGRVAAVAEAMPVPTGWRDWRIEHLVSLMGDDWLAREWDAERQVVVPLPGGRLTRVRRCVVGGCPSDRHGVDPLCVRHRRQFDAAATGDVEAWAASGEPVVLERRHCVDRPCAVVGADTERCPRPGQGRWSLCPAHSAAWAHRRAKGVAFEAFLASAAPLRDLGPCVVGCCYLAMTHPESGLCEPHFQLWRAAARPAAQRSALGRRAPASR